VRFDLDGMNTLVDLAMIAGCDVVSSLKGELISSVNFADLPRVDRITAHKSRIVLMHKGTARVVAQHVQRLRERRESEVEAVSTLLDARIRSLMSNHVIIRLTNDRNFVIKSQAVDRALRAVRSAIQHGIEPDGSLSATAAAVALHAPRCRAEIESLGAGLL
jgi:hypothetical protein